MNNRLGFSYFLFLLFYFSVFPSILFLVFVLLFFILDLGKEYDVTLCMTVTQVTNHDENMTHVNVTGYIIM